VNECKPLVCGEADPDFWAIEGDLIVQCDGCDEQVHLSCYGLGRPVLVDPMRPKLKPPGTKRLKLRYDEPLTNLLSISTCAAIPGRGAGRRLVLPGVCGRRGAGRGVARRRRRVRAVPRARQGLTLVHFSAQPKPFWSHHPVSPCLINWGKIVHPTHPTKCARVELKSGRV
jgi:hypothetical protein